MPGGLRARGFTWRRHDWARWLLAFSAGFAFLLALAAFPVGMIHQLACALTIGGLFNTDHPGVVRALAALSRLTPALTRPR